MPSLDTPHERLRVLSLFPCDRGAVNGVLDCCRTLLVFQGSIKSQGRFLAVEMGGERMHLSWDMHVFVLRRCACHSAQIFLSTTKITITKFTRLVLSSLFL